GARCSLLGNTIKRALSTQIPGYLLNIPATEVTTLPNGVRVASQGGYGQTSSVGIFIDTGSRYETKEKNGVAHYVEHLSFKGTQRRSRVDIEKEIENMGAHLNAYTSREQTVYYSRCFNKDLGQTMDILSDILLHSKFDTAAVNNERRTILLEADDVFQNKYEVVFDLLHETAYQGCGLGLTILGPESNIKKITRDDLFDYVHTHYTAPRVVVAGAGSINHQDLVAMAEKTFGHLPVKPTNGIIVPPLTKQFTSSIKTLVDDKYPFCSIAVAFEAEGWSHADALVFMIIQTVVGQWNRMSGAGTNLPSAFCSTVAHEDLAHSVSTFFTCYKDTSLFGVYSECPKETIPRLMEVTMQALRTVCDTVTSEQVEHAKRQLKASLLMQLDDSSSNVEDIGRQMQMYGRRITPAETFARIDAIDLNRVKEVAYKYLVNKPMAVSAYGPVETLPPIEWFREHDRV
ncbi:hypothetical protein WA538_000540, partial [Blastocystis sp. DL]